MSRELIFFARARVHKVPASKVQHGVYENAVGQTVKKKKKNKIKMMLTDNFVLMNFDRIRYLLISSSLRLGPLLSPRIQNVSAAPNKELLLSILLCRLSEKRTEMSDVQFDDHYYYREAFD